ncbi:hypothetical protein [Streptomyces boninensis]|uniref:hypothetical protein n=1 Tax=Streptomyces boninensis TaxID=2039455 RepID=UPI003B223935
MNIRSLTRGDAVVLVGALLLIVASFLKFISADCPSGAPADACDKINEDMPGGWSDKIYPTVTAVFIAGIIAAILIVIGRMQPEGKKPAGLALDQVGTGLAAGALLSALWSIIQLPGGAADADEAGAGMGAWLALLGTLAIAAGAILTNVIPAFKAPLLGSPNQPAMQGGYPQQGGQPGYGYPGGPQGGQPGPGQPYGQQQPQPAYGGAPQPGPGGPGGPGAPQRQDAPPAGGGGSFAPFWFAVPAARPLFAEDGSNAQVAELAPGIWYLAVDQRGPALIAQTQDGRRGVLQDTSGIQRG